MTVETTVPTAGPARAGRPGVPSGPRTPASVPASAAVPSAAASREVALVDLLDRLLAGGVVITGDLTLSIADVDLVRISLNAVITSVKASMASPWER